VIITTKSNNRALLTGCDSKTHLIKTEYYQVVLIPVV